jgi:alpha-glucosidase
VQAQRADPSSTLQLYRTALRLRRELDALGDGELLWRSEPGDDVLCFGRPGRGDAPEVVCIVNLGSAPTPLPGTPALASGPLTADGLLPPDTAAWLTGEASHRGTS